MPMGSSAQCLCLIILVHYLGACQKIFRTCHFYCQFMVLEKYPVGGELESLII